MSWAEILESEFGKLELELAAKQRDKLAVYCSELVHWNRKINLTSLAGAVLVRRLIAEPAWVGERLGISGRLADIGSGNGSPALPLCITRPVAEAHLIESRLKRAVFLRHMVAKTMLSNTYINNDRFEAVAPGLGAMDWITLQAVALTDSLLDAVRQTSGATTKIVWITSQRQAPVPSSTRIIVPGSLTEVWVFTLESDQQR